MSRRSFTLIEIMIVVLLIGVLASLALPNFLEAEAEAEAARLLTQVAQAETAWTELFGKGEVAIGDSSLAVGSHLVPEPLVPLLPPLRQGTKLGGRELVLGSDGKPIPDPSDQTGYKFTRKPIPLLLAAGGIEFRTGVVPGSKYKSLQRFGITGDAVQISVRSNSAHGREVLEFALAHWREAGVTLQVIVWGNDIEVCLYPKV